MLSLEFDDYAFIICCSLMLFYEVFIKSPKQTSRQDVRTIAKNANLLTNGTPKDNAGRTPPKDTTTKNSQSTEIACPKDTPEGVSDFDQTSCHEDKNENVAIPSTIPEANIIVAASSDNWPVTTRTLSEEVISTPTRRQKSKLKDAETRSSSKMGQTSKPKDLEITSTPRRRLKSKPKSVEVGPASKTGLKSKPKVYNKINKRSKSLANVRVFRETSKQRNVKNSKGKGRSQSTSPNPFPRRQPTKLHESITSSSEPEDKKLDLHGYTVDEATREFDQFYSKTEGSRLKEWKEEDRYIYVVTGRGNGCIDGIPKIRPAVQRLLDKWNVRHSWRNDGGLVMIDFCEQDEEVEEEDTVTHKRRDQNAKRKDKKKKGRNRNKKGKHNFYFKLH